MMNRNVSAILAIAALVVASGCGRDDTPGLVASAKSYLDKSDHKSAIIQLRNARQQAPNDAEIRFLLGRALLENGEASAAEVELRKALDLKHPADAVLPLLAQSLVGQAEFRKVTTEFASLSVSDPAARADLATTVAIAHLAQGDIKSGRASLDAALAARPGYPRAQVVMAQLAIRGNDVAGAEAALDAALRTAPNDPDAIVMKAELLSSQGRREDGVRLLEQAVAANPFALQPKFALISMLVISGQLDKAEATLAAMKKEAEADFRTVYSEALIALARGDATKARELSQPLIANRPDHLPSVYLGALADYQLKNYDAAEDALRRVIARVPDDPGPRRVLVAVLVRSGRTIQAIEAADVGLRRAPDDPVLLRLAGEARILSGSPAEAARFYERAAAVESGSSASKLRLAQIRLATGDASRGLADLEKLSAADSANIQADLALYTAHLRRREYDKALAAIASIEKKQPGTALVHDLRGTVFASKFDLKTARASFAKALEMEPGRLSSARSLALLDLQEGKVADAKARYEKLIAANPKSEQPLIALAEIQALSGAPAADVKASLDRAVAANPTAIGPRLALVTHHRRVGDVKGALEAARAAATALPNEPQILELYGVVQLANGEFVPARETFSRLAQLLPQNPLPLLRVAEAHIGARDFVSALDAQRKALALQPDHAPGLVALATTYLAAGRPDEAMAEARRLQRERPKAAIGFALESELLAAQKQFSGAANAMREAVARQPNAALAARHLALLGAAGRPADAAAFADRWTKDHPKDASFLNLVGQQRQASNDASGAVKAYRAALEIEPDNVVVLNNLAWLLNEQGRPEARELAERAYRLAPLNASVADTLGFVLIRQGELARGITLLRMATNLAPNDTRLRLHLAQGLAKSGDKAAARRELEQVIRDPRTPVKAEADQLLREL